MATVADTVEQVGATGLWDGVQSLATLPAWLNEATSPEAVSAALQRVVPEFASGALTIRGCDVSSVRIKRDNWTGSYTLTVADQEGSEREVVLRGAIIPPSRDDLAERFAAEAGDSQPFGAAEWRCYLPELRVALEPQPPDAALPSLPILTDAEQARALLETSIRAANRAYADLRIVACTPKIMRYTPGSRCTVLYRLQYPDDVSEKAGWPSIAVAKTYRGNKGRHADGAMRALWNSDFITTSGVALAEPLGFLPDLNVLIQGPVVEEQTLQKLMEMTFRSGDNAAFDELHAYTRKAAAGLAALHRSEVRYGEVHRWEDELAEVRAVVATLDSAVPGYASLTAPVLDRLQALSNAHPADPIVPAHSTFRPGQVLLNRGEIGFIDFDSFGQSEPALDLALFLRRTKDIALSVLPEDDAAAREARRTTLLAQAEELCETFLSAYAAHNPVSRERVALWVALDLFTLVLHSWTKVKPTRLRNAVPVLDQHLRGMGVY